jgi:hypothetical protein
MAEEPADYAPDDSPDWHTDKKPKPEAIHLGVPIPRSVSASILTLSHPALGFVKSLRQYLLHAAALPEQLLRHRSLSFRDGKECTAQHSLQYH